MAVKDLMKGAANDIEQTKKAKAKPAEVVTETQKSEESTTDTTKKENSEINSTETQKKEEPTTDTTKKENSEKDTATDSKQKKSGGRRPNEYYGLKKRKQYTLTLKEDTYNFIVDKAREEELSFAKFMERAALEYIENHK